MHKQRGITFIGLVFVIAAIVFVAVIGLKLTPAYLEFFNVKKAITKIGNEPTFATMSKKDIIDEFDRSATIDDIKVIKGGDLIIEKGDDKPIVTADYQATVPLVGNVSALLDFNASTQADKQADSAATP